MAKLGSDEVVDAFEFAIRLIGPKSVVVLDRLAVGARLRRSDDGDYTIELRDELPDINFACAHEMAHWALREVWKYSGNDEERLANRLGAALLMPKTLVEGVVRWRGGGLRPVAPLARMVEVSQTAAQLRIAEVIGDERAVVTRSGNLIVRNAAAVDWSDPRIPQTLRPGVRHPGLAKSLLHGGIDEGRVALTVRRAG
jgi:hypothetical protein